MDEEVAETRGRGYDYLSSWAKWGSLDDLTLEDRMAYMKPWNAQLRFKLDHNGELHENIYTATDELRFKSDMLKVINKTASKPPK